MHRNYVTLASILLLAAASAGPLWAQDPNLIGWWTFDEGSGTVAHDATGHGYEGTVTDAKWVTGMHGSALNFDAVGYVDVPASAWATISKQVTVAFWAYGDPAIQPQAHVTFGAYIDVADNNARVASCHVPWSDGTVYWDTSGTTGVWSPDRISKAATAAEYEGQWRHWTFVKNAGTGVQSIYLNGVLWHKVTGMTQLMAGNKVTGFTIGDRPLHDSPYAGMIDDFRLYNRALTDAEIKKLALRPKAYAPIPADGATGVTSPVLQWTKGDTAAYHDIYLGTTPDLGPADKKARQMQLMAMYYYAPGWTPGATYYWRIDEVEANGTVHTGDVWSFAVTPLTAYSPTPRNGDKWIDPNTDLSWQPGQGAIGHEVYFGTDEAAVTARDQSVFKVSTPEATFTLDTLAPETTYYWVVDEAGTTKYPGTVWHFTTTGGGGGVKAEYFNNMTLFGTPALTRIESAIDFSWGDPGSPGPQIGNDSFSARFTADLEIAVADTYTFITTSDDGARLWLDEVLIIDTWVDQGATDHASKPLKLDPGVYSLRMEYYENTGGTTAQLSWQTPSVPRQIIPPGPLQPPVRAKAIYPTDNEVNIPQDVTLMWSIGEKAVTHDVYFGEDEAAVAAATREDTGIYKGSQDRESNTWPSVGLDWNKTYYWRIDEVNDASEDSPWRSPVWSFTTADFIVVDDFESYTDETTGRIFQTWIDGWGYTEPAPGNPGNGTGSTVGYTSAPFAETTVVHGARQAMPFDYNNVNSPYYSETDRTWTSVQNWTLGGMTTMSLQFRGYPVRFRDDGTTITMSAAGNDIWDVADTFRFAFKRLSGDGSITAKVNSVVQTNVWAKAGVMIRETLAVGSANAANVVSAASGVSFQWRSWGDGTCSNTGQTGLVAPYWVRLTRTANTLKAEISADNKTWSIVGTDAATSSIDITMMGTLYIGLCVTSHNTDAKIATTAVFSDVKTTGGVSGQWQVADIGMTHPGNDPAQLYVAVQDGAGKTAVVKHPDLNAVLSADWTEWQIPLTQFTGVNAKTIKRMFIGVGDRVAPQAGGTGKLFIDDIRIVKP